jgi:hypothetical protein
MGPLLRRVFYVAVCAVFPAAAQSQNLPIKVDLVPLLSTFQHQHWYDAADKTVGDAVRAAFLQARFQLTSVQGTDVTTLSIPDGIKKETINDGQLNITFMVVFSRDGTKKGEAFESCPDNMVSECVDQLVLDTKAAASN